MAVIGTNRCTCPAKERRWSTCRDVHVHRDLAFRADEARSHRDVPPMSPRPDVLVFLTGLAELAGAIGLLLPATPFWAACGLIVQPVAQRFWP